MFRFMLLLCFFSTAALADNPPAAQEGQSKDIIIENGYVAEPALPEQAQKNEAEERDYKTYDDPYQYDYDSMGKFEAAHSPGMHGGGGGGRR